MILFHARFRVRAANRVGFGNYSDTTLITTLPPQPPTAPSTLTLLNTSATTLTHAWEAAEYRGYVIEAYQVQMRNEDR